MKSVLPASVGCDWLSKGGGAPPCGSGDGYLAQSNLPSNWLIFGLYSTTTKRDVTHSDRHLAKIRRTRAILAESNFLAKHFFHFFLSINFIYLTLIISIKCILETMMLCPLFLIALQNVAKMQSLRHRFFD